MSNSCEDAESIESVNGLKDQQGQKEKQKQIVEGVPVKPNVSVANYDTAAKRSVEDAKSEDKVANAQKRKEKQGKSKGTAKGAEAHATQEGRIKSATRSADSTTATADTYVPMHSSIHFVLD